MQLIIQDRSELSDLWLEHECTISKENLNDQVRFKESFAMFFPIVFVLAKDFTYTRAINEQYKQIFHPNHQCCVLSFFFHLVNRIKIKALWEIRLINVIIQNRMVQYILLFYQIAIGRF